MELIELTCSTLLFASMSHDKDVTYSYNIGLKIDKNWWRSKILTKLSVKCSWRFKDLQGRNTVEVNSVFYEQQVNNCSRTHNMDVKVVHACK